MPSMAMLPISLPCRHCHTHSGHSASLTGDQCHKASMGVAAMQRSATITAPAATHNRHPKRLGAPSCSRNSSGSIVVLQLWNSCPELILPKCPSTGCFQDQPVQPQRRPLRRQNHVLRCCRCCTHLCTLNPSGLLVHVHTTSSSSACDLRTGQHFTVLSPSSPVSRHRPSWACWWTVDDQMVLKHTAAAIAREPRCCLIVTQVQPPDLPVHRDTPS